MITTKIKNTNNYIIKIISNNIDLYNKNELKTITKKVLENISSKNKLSNNIEIIFYYDKSYGLIIIVNNSDSYNDNNEYDVKIIVNIDTPFLYKIDFFDIKENNFENEIIYYYKNNFYLKIKNPLNTSKYYNLLELSEIIFDDQYTIIKNGIKINI